MKYAAPITDYIIKSTFNEEELIRRPTLGDEDLILKSEFNIEDIIRRPTLGDEDLILKSEFAVSDIFMGTPTDISQPVLQGLMLNISYNKLYIIGSVRQMPYILIDIELYIMGMSNKANMKMSINTCYSLIGEVFNQHTHAHNDSNIGPFETYIYRSIDISSYMPDISAGDNFCIILEYSAESDPTDVVIRSCMLNYGLA